MDFEGVKNLVLKKLDSELDKDLHYHSSEHTKDVLQATERLAEMEGVNGYDLELLKIAALFHDLGFLNSYEHHEKASVELANKILPDYGYSQEDLKKIEGMIMSTQLPQEPSNLLEKIIADADLFDLGTDDYFILSEKLFEEWNLCIEPSSKEKQWYHSLNFLKEHKYFTVFGRDVLESKKQHNIAILQERLAKKLY